MTVNNNLSLPNIILSLLNIIWGLNQILLSWNGPQKSLWQILTYLKTCEFLIFFFFEHLMILHPCFHQFPFQFGHPIHFSCDVFTPLFLCQWGYFCVPVLLPLSLYHLSSPLPICPLTYGQGWPPGVQLLPLSMSANQTQACWERACHSVRNCCWRPLVGHTHCCPSDLWFLVQWLHPVWTHKPLCCP